MTPTLLLPLLLAAQAAPAQDQDAVRLDLWPRTLRYGEPVTVAVRPGRDGYLTVLRLDTDGRWEVLFPLQLTDKGSVRAGEHVLVNDRLGNPGFVAYERDGVGTVLAALSDGPFDFTGASLGGFPSRVRLSDVGRDRVGALLRQVERMAGSNEFVYDVAHYRVREYGLLGFGGRYAGWPECYGFGPGYRFGRFYYGLGHRAVFRSAYYDPFSPLWFGNDAYDSACFDGFGFGSDWGRVVIRRPLRPPSRPDSGVGRPDTTDVEPYKPRRRDPAADTAPAGPRRRPESMPAGVDDRDRIEREPRGERREERPARERPAVEPRRPDPPADRRPQVERPRDTGARPASPPPRPSENRPPPPPKPVEKKPQA